jgi:S1-C subfamily serine protease
LPDSELPTHASIGVFFEGNPDVRRDGVAIAAVTAGGPTDRAGIKAGDVILAINDLYLFTIGELTHQVSHLQPGTKIVVRYRRIAMISEASVTVGTIQSSLGEKLSKGHMRRRSCGPCWSGDRKEAVE